MFVRMRLLSLASLVNVTLLPAIRGALTPSLYHMKVRGSVPLAAQVKVTLSPTSRVADSGLVATITGTAMQRVQLQYTLKDTNLFSIQYS